MLNNNMNFNQGKEMNGNNFNNNFNNSNNTTNIFQNVRLIRIFSYWK